MLEIAMLLRHDYTRFLSRNAKCSIFYTVSKNDTDVAHYNFDAHQQILVILAEMLVRECAIK